MNILIAAFTILALGLLVYLLDRFGLWMEERGWIYYRKRSGSRGSYIGNGLHELHSFFEHDIHEADQEIEVRQEQRASISGKPFEDEITDQIDRMKME